MANARIVVVEDEGIVALDIQSKLEAMGYEVPAVAASASEALAKVEDLNPDLVLMDIQLEGDVDGVQAAEQITRQLRIPVVYLTAYSDETTVERAKSTHPLGYLLKPFEERELYATVEMALYRHQSEREKMRLEERLRQSEKMEAIGQLTIGLAQNFNNILHGVIGNLDLASAEAPDELRPFLEDAAYDAEAAAKLVAQLALFYHQEQKAHTAVDVTAIVDDTASICRETFPTRIAITVDHERPLPTTFGNRDQLRQCVVSLCTNARDALAEKQGEIDELIQITVGSLDLAAQQAEESRASSAAAGEAESRHAGAGRYIRISVEDNGAGMDGPTQARMFEPFFSTKKSGLPNGLGLAVVYGIVRDHNGWVECRSELGEGTTVSIFLPVVAAYDRDLELSDAHEVGITDMRATSADSLRGSESVLVVASVDRSRKILDLMLEQHGYAVQLGRDGRDGLNLFRHEPDVDLVVLELSPPGMSNQEVLAELLNIAPHIKVLIVTGHPMGAGLWRDAAAVLVKPFGTVRFLQAVRQALEAG